MEHSDLNLDSEFEFIVRKKGNQFFLHLPQWQILVKGTDFNQAFTELRDQRNTLLTHFREAGIEHELPQATAPARSEHHDRMDFLPSLMKSLAVTLTVAMVIGIFFFISADLVGRKIIKNITQPFVSSSSQEEISPATLGRKATDLFIKFANTTDQLTPERQEELTDSIRKIVQKLKPVVSELKPLFTQIEPTIIEHPTTLNEKIKSSNNLSP